jgi:serine/threonine protein kinase
LHKQDDIRRIDETPGAGNLHNLFAMHELRINSKMIPCVMSEPADGELFKLVKQRMFTSGGAVWADCAKQLCQGLDRMHSLDIAHNDIKPENVFYKRLPDGSMRYMLADFGGATRVDPRTVHTACHVAQLQAC